MFCSKCGLELQKNDKLCSKCGEKVSVNGSEGVNVVIQKNDKNRIDKNADIDFFYISLFQLFLLNFITAGLYQLYWFIKNWTAVSNSDGKKRKPFWRGIFSIFYCYSLFKIILNEAKKIGYKTIYSPTFLFAFYIFLFIFDNIADEVSKKINLPFPWYAWLIVIIIESIPIIIIQRAINYYKIEKKLPIKKKFTAGEMALIGLGIMMFIIFIIVNNPFN